MTKDIGSLKELYRLFESKKFWSEVKRGTPLASAIPGGVNITGSGADAWTLTFEDDFLDIAATLGNNNEAKKWKCPGPYDTIGSGKMAPYTPAPAAGAIYRQQSASVIGMLARKDTGIQRWSANLSTGTFAPSPLTYNDEPNISFAQQYYYAEASIKMPNPNVPVAAGVILWPAFWAYSISNLGGMVTGDMTRNPVEKDFLEWYLDPTNEGTSSQWHGAMHHHEPQKLVGPGAWGRDVNSSNIHTIPGSAAMQSQGGAFPSTWRPWDGFHTYGALHTPEEIILFVDRIEVARGAIPPRYHSKDYFLLSHQLSTELAGGMIGEQEYVMEADYVRIWQNPDWHTVGGTWDTRKAPAAAGTASAATYATALPMASYLTGRMFVLDFPNGLSAGATLNMNGLGAKPVYRYSNYDTIPPSGTLSPIQDGDVAAGGWHGLRYDATLNGGNGGWRLQNAGWSYKYPTQWNPAVPAKAPVVVNRQQIEAGIAEKHGVATSVFPVGHPGQTRQITDTDVPPKGGPSKSHLVVEGLAPGTLIDTMVPVNSPTRPVLYSKTGSSKYVVDPVTGQLRVAPGAVLTVGRDEVLVGAWPQPPQAMVPGSNIEKHIIDVKPDVPFDLSYFADDAIGTLPVWIEPGDISTLTLDTDNTVLTVMDKLRSDYVYAPTDATVNRRAAYSATALNGVPALVGSTTQVRYVYPSGMDIPVATSTLTNIAVRNTNQVSIGLHGTTRISAAFDPLNVHMVLFQWEPGSIRCFVDDVEIGMAAGTVTTGITTKGFAFFVIDPLQYGASANNLGRVYDSGSLMNSTALDGGFSGAWGRLAIAFPSAGLTDAYRRKIFGEAAAKFGLRGLLPADSPYKTVSPRMYN